MIRLGITGTDTGVGKTIVGCALAAAFARRGQRVIAMKPIETGVSANDPERDGARLALAARHEHSLNITAPTTLPDPVAPLVAARRAGTSIDVTSLDHALDAASTGADVLLVEGAGGLLVPITDTMSFDALFRRWGLGLLIVGSNRLGVINSVRLTCAAARAASLPISAVVLVDLFTGDDASAPDNPYIIAELEAVTVVGIPWLDRPYDFDLTAVVVERVGLVDVVSRPPSLVPQ